MAKVHNLDENVVEYFEFSIFNHTYKFRLPNTEETDRMREYAENEQESRNYLFTFIEPVSPDAPAFPEVSKKMNTRHWSKFMEMVKVEFA